MSTMSIMSIMSMGIEYSYLYHGVSPADETSQTSSTHKNIQIHFQCKGIALQIQYCTIPSTAHPSETSLMTDQDSPVPAPPCRTVPPSATTDSGVRDFVMWRLCGAHRDEGGNSLSWCVRDSVPPRDSLLAVQFTCGTSTYKYANTDVTRAE
jgi:hypothetical protein